MFCPSCGGQIDADTRFARLVVCGYCDSAVVLDEKAARVAGKMAVLAQTPSPLFIGGSGTLLGRRFNILGRVRYGYDRGYWDEWFLAFEDGGTAWISEDENNFALETCEDAEQPPVDYASILPGATLTLGETDFHLDEKGVAECEGGEGQLPFAIVSGEKVPFLDLSAGDAFATVEYDLEDNTARVFRGRRLDITEVTMDQTAEEAGVGGGALGAERAATEGKRERIVRREDRAKDIKCDGCGAPLEIPDTGAESMTCKYCGVEIDLTLRRITCSNCSAQVPVHGGGQARSVVCPQCDGMLDISKREPSLLEMLVGSDRPKVPFKIGQACRFRGEAYRVAGHIRFVERDAWGTYRSDEFLLFGKTAGYKYLLLENGHFSWSEELDDRPATFDPRVAARKQRFSFLGRGWRVFESATQEVEWVDGELPWVAQIGDKNQYMDAISPPQILSAEWTESEMEWYRAEYLSRAEVAAGFGVAEGELPPPVGVAPHQPCYATRFRPQAAVVMGVGALVLAVLSLFSYLRDGAEAGRVTITPDEYHEPFIVGPITVTGRRSLCEARFNSDVNNSWIYLDVVVVNAADEAVVEFSAEMSHYHGVEGGEGWSEGSRKDSVPFKLAEPGEYRLLVQGQAGTGAQTGDARQHGTAVRITVHEGVVLSRYFLAGMVFCLVWLILEVVRRAQFEKARWGDEDDDDDDD